LMLSSRHVGSGDIARAASPPDAPDASNRVRGSFDSTARSSLPQSPATACDMTTACNPRNDQEPPQ
jgi:hypothetical protein